MSQAGSLTTTGGITPIGFPITVPEGGTGQVSFPAHTVLLGEGTAPIGNVGPGAANTILMGAGAGSDPVFGTLVAGSNITLTNGPGTITISATSTTPNSITFTDDAGTTATTNAGAINLFGTSAQGISVLGNGASTITVSAANATTSQKGVVQLADNATTIAGTNATTSVTPLSLANKLGVQTAHGVMLGEGSTSPLGATAAGSTNTVLLGNSGADPSFGQVPNAALQNSSVTLNSGNNITVTGGGPLALGGTASFNVTGTTNHAVQVGNASGSLSSIALGTNGQVLIGSTGADPIFGTITSPDNSILIGLGAGTLTLQGNSAKFGETITGNTGGPLSPTAGNWNILGNNTQGLTFNGAGSTLTGTISSATTTQLGVILLASNAETIAGTNTTKAVTPDDLKAKLGVQTVNGIAFGQGTTSPIGWTAAGTTGQVLIANTGGAPTWGAPPPPALTITGDDSVALSPTANNWNIDGQQAGTIPVMITHGAVSTLSIEDRTWPTQYVVDPSSTVGLRGTFTTIAAAIAAASSGQTIFIRPGTYTENLTLKAGLNLCSFGSSSSLFTGEGDVIIKGKMTFTGSGTVSLFGLTLETNGDFALAVTGTNPSIVNINNCVIDITNNTGISFTSSNSSAEINIWYSTVVQGADNIAYFTHSSSGLIYFYHSHMQWSTSFTNSKSTQSAGGLTIDHCVANFALTTSGTATANVSFSYFDSANQTTFTIGGSGGLNIRFCVVSSGSATSVIANTATSVYDSAINSNNTNAISGTNTLTYSDLTFQGSSQKISTTTQIGGVAKGGVTQAPSAGFIGEQIRSAIASGAAISLSNGVAANITSISLTAGIWDVSAIGVLQGSLTGTGWNVSISTTSAVEGTNGDNKISSPTVSSAATALGLSVPSYRLTLTTTTTIYLVGVALFSSGTAVAYGRISGTRVG